MCVKDQSDFLCLLKTENVLVQSSQEYIATVEISIDCSPEALFTYLCASIKPVNSIL